MKLQKKIIYSGLITLKTGLHIGGSNTTLNIGGIDNAVVRNPINNEPYIPGSSLKGKMRSLVEVCLGQIGPKGGPSNNLKDEAAALFGTAASNKDTEQCHPSRLIVRDAFLNEQSRNLLVSINTDMPFTESKAEVNIDRITGKSISGVRFTERVPAGAKFKFSMVLNIFDGDNETSLRDTLQTAFKLLEDDYLGGNGSRGYGQIIFENVEKVEKTY